MIDRNGSEVTFKGSPARRLGLLRRAFWCHRGLPRPLLSPPMGWGTVGASRHVVRTHHLRAVCDPR